MVYDVNYFINKFSAIPEEKWVKGALYNDRGESCANGHCNVKPYTVDGKVKFSVNMESAALQRVFSVLGTRKIYDSELQPNYSDIAASINNGIHPDYQQDTPKQRILAALEDIKRMTYPTKTVYVKVEEKVVKEEVCLQ